MFFADVGFQIVVVGCWSYWQVDGSCYWLSGVGCRVLTVVVPKFFRCGCPAVALKGTE